MSQQRTPRTFRFSFKQPLLFFFWLGLGTLLARAQDSTAIKKTAFPQVDGSNGRCLPSPISSPPFPGSEWDGAPVIGLNSEAPDYPLQRGLGLKGNKSRIKIYGWLDGGVNLSSSKHSNAPTSYDIVPNKPELDQMILRIERQPNTIQTTHFDWGFVVDNILGTDYRYTIAKGLFSDQLLKHNNLYGYDLTQAYATLYLPKVAEGLLLKVGRFISPADIEAQWAPDNYLYSHSLMFTVDPYTFTGVQATIRFSPYWQLELGAHSGNDVVPWSNSASFNGLAMIRWVSKNNNNSLYAGINSLGSGKYKHEHDNLQMFVATWGHRFSNTVHMMTEGYYLFQRDALTGGTVINGPGREFYEGTGIGTFVPGISSAVGFVNYFQILLSQKDYLSVRNDLLNDPQGNRTGYATAYSSHTIGWSHSFSSLVKIRPELRYEHAYSNTKTPYDNGTKRNQYTAAMDLIVRF